MNQPAQGHRLVRFCIFCGERDDSPYRTRWCDEDPIDEGAPRHYHRFGHVQEVVDADPDKG